MTHFNKIVTFMYVNMAFLYHLPYIFRLCNKTLYSFHVFILSFFISFFHFTDLFKEQDLWFVVFLSGFCLFVCFKLQWLLPSFTPSLPTPCGFVSLSFHLDRITQHTPLVGGFCTNAAPERHSALKLILANCLSVVEQQQYPLKGSLQFAHPFSGWRLGLNCF